MLNTDTWNDDSLIGIFPLSWVESDIIAASMQESTAFKSHFRVDFDWEKGGNSPDCLFHVLVDVLRILLK